MIEFILMVCLLTPYTGIEVDAQGLRPDYAVDCQTAILPSKQICEFHMHKFEVVGGPIAFSCFPKPRSEDI